MGTDKMNPGNTEVANLVTVIGLEDRQEKQAAGFVSNLQLTKPAACFPELFCGCCILFYLFIFAELDLLLQRISTFAGSMPRLICYRSTLLTLKTKLGIPHPITGYKSLFPHLFFLKCNNVTGSEWG